MIVTTDLHFTDRRIDEYRFKVFDWLHELLDEKEEPVAILGDITDYKDNHSNILINKIVDKLVSISERVPLYILVGNHDFKDKNFPLLKFLNYIPNIKIFLNPTLETTHLGDTLFLPYTKNPNKEWVNYKNLFTKANIIFTHIGGPLDGVKQELVKKLGYNGYIYSGDIHIPQQLGKVIYVGSPYPIHFGDDKRLDTRIIRVKKDSSFIEYKFDTIKKLTVKIEDLSDLDSYTFSEGDQVKLIIRFNKYSNNDPKKLSNLVIKKMKNAGVVIHSTKYEPYSKEEKIKIDVKFKTDLDIVKELVDNNNLDKEFFELAKAIIEAGYDRSN